MIDIYQKLLDYPRLLLACALFVLLAAAPGLFNFSFDASPETLVVEGDPNLQTYLEKSAIFGGDEFIALTYQPSDGDVFAPEALRTIKEIQGKLNQVPGVASTFSILNAPLLTSSGLGVEELEAGYHTLASPEVDITLARSELIGSPLFSNYLISSDGEATAIRIDLSRNSEMEVLLAQGFVNPEEDEARKARLDELRKAYVEDRARLIEELRQIGAEYLQSEIHITGVPIIAADMVSYVRSDLETFSGIILIVICVLMWIFFRRLRWVWIPMLTVFISIYCTASLLGYLAVPVTVVSSNFVSLLAIICLSFTIHLIVRYRELANKEADKSHGELVAATMVSKFPPCLYTALTTLIAFASMSSSGIVPIEDFGWMMCVGIVISFVVVFTIFPALLLLLSRQTPSSTSRRKILLNQILNTLCRRYPAQVVLFSVLLTVVSIYGFQFVSFENRFVEYFGAETDVSKSMLFVDKHLGGTVPFEFYLQFPEFEAVEEEDDFFMSAPDSYPERYWFDRQKLDTLAVVHDKLNAEPAVGKVISLATLEVVATGIHGSQLSSVELAYLVGALPQSIRKEMIEPYAQPDLGLMRISGRVVESHEQYRPFELTERLKEISEAEDGVVFTGMLVLFNDMLLQLAESQIQTMYYVVTATYLMFALLLRSLLLSALALLPNLLSASLIIAFMGYSNIPMDMMTITIAAICIGIGVDDAIHYLHRFQKELQRDGEVLDAITRAHETIGRAMYFTTTVVVAGFSVLVFSHFVPSIYFGLLTALTMVLALLANLTVLPSLLALFYVRLGLSAKI